jgi:hypothetical protein
MRSFHRRHALTHHRAGHEGRRAPGSAEELFERAEHRARVVAVHIDRMPAERAQPVGDRPNVPDPRDLTVDLQAVVHARSR